MLFYVTLNSSIFYTMITITITITTIMSGIITLNYALFPKKLLYFQT